MTAEEIIKEELYLFKIAHRVLKWADFTDYKEEELADLVVQELLDIKK